LFDPGRNDLEGRVVAAKDAFLGIPAYDREDVFFGTCAPDRAALPEWRECDIHTLTELNSTRTVHAFWGKVMRPKAQYEPCFALACKTKVRHRPTITTF
jgi:hypothetical protein